MSYLGDPFLHDLFVSYSHGAFKGTHDSDLKLWSQKFANDLRAEIAGTTEFADISVFLDEGDRSEENVDRTEQLTGLLGDRVTKSALFTLLMTPHYLRSKWCRQELEWWCEKHHPDTLGAGSRAYVCRVRPSDQAAWPGPIKDVVGYFCYDRDEHPDRARPFTWRDSTEDRNEYNRVLIDLAGDMMQRLRAVKKILEEQEQGKEDEERLAAKGGQVLYLHGRDVYADAWKRAGGKLRQSGLVVLPGQPDPVVPDHKAAREVTELRVQTLTGCDGLLLLGTEDGRALDADMVVVGRQDRHSARDRCHRLLPCAVLDTVGPEIATPERCAAAKGLGIRWIDATNDIWTAQLRDWLVGSSAVAAHG